MNQKNYVTTFHNKEKQKEYQELKSKANDVRRDFVTRFGIDALKKLEGENLLRHMFYNDKPQDKENMCYMLERNKDCHDIFGGIGGNAGTMFNFGLFYRKDGGVWITGSPRKPRILSLEEAIIVGTNIRNMLVQAAEVFNGRESPSSLEDYISVYRELKEIELFSSIKI